MYAVRTLYNNGPIVTRWFATYEAAARYAAIQKIAVVYAPDGHLIQ